MNKNKKIYLRNELNYNEKRTVLIPSDIELLIKNNYIIWIQSSISSHRIFTDIKYKNAGGIITTLPWYHESFKDFIIIGLKELDNLEKLNLHTHIYFSHCFKNQANSINILDKFAKSSSIIYDFEYLVNEQNQRIISFGFYAGTNGCILGLIQYFNKLSNNNINNLVPWNNFDQMLDCVKIFTKNFYFYQIQSNIKIGIIGPNGNTGKGVQYILDKLGFNYDKIYRKTKKDNLNKYDILYNCINLSTCQNEIWFDSNTIFNSNIIIVDISCDYNKPNNPIKIYSNKTTWENPVFKFNKYVDIISIDNLPSLLPSTSSIDFSNIFTNLLLNGNDNIWNTCLEKFNNIIINK